VICLQDIPHPERIGLSIPIDAVSALSDAFNHASVLEFPNAHLDARLRNTPIGHEPADIILARVVFDDDIQGMLVCRKEQDRDWPVNSRALIDHFVALAEQALLMLQPDTVAWRHLLWQQRLHKLTYQLATKTGRLFFTELVEQLATEIGADAVWIGELLQVGHGTASVRIIAGCGATIALEHHRYPLQDSSCRLLYLADNWIIQSMPDVPVTMLIQPKWLIAVPLRHNQQRIIGHLSFTFSDQHPDPNELVRALQPLLIRIEAELIRYQVESELRLSSVAFDTNKGCIITDPTLTIMRVNQAFTEITGISAEQAIGCELGKEIWSFSEQQSDSLSKGLHWRGEMERKRLNGGNRSPAPA
jgi:PAS domain-containing protein